ncbi:MAG: hypothetical protein LUF85_12875 [Bacteroides sp.]|nr:hypothetical protein [Bacteroides sp.]
MRLMDYFFYVVTNFQISILKRNEEDSRFSSSLILGEWLALALLVPFSYIEKLYPNKLTHSILNNVLGFVSSGIFLAALIFIRYFRYTEYEELISWRRNLGRFKAKSIYIFFLITFWGAPVAAFIAFRLYLYGYVKWW